MFYKFGYLVQTMHHPLESSNLCFPEPLALLLRLCKLLCTLCLPSLCWCNHTSEYAIIVSEEGAALEMLIQNIPKTRPSHSAVLVCLQNPDLLSQLDNMTSQANALLEVFISALANYSKTANQTAHLKEPGAEHPEILLAQLNDVSKPPW